MYSSSTTTRSSIGAPNVSSSVSNSTDGRRWNVASISATAGLSARAPSCDRRARSVTMSPSCVTARTPAGSAFTSGTRAISEISSSPSPSRATSASAGYTAMSCTVVRGQGREPHWPAVLPRTVAPTGS